MRIQIKQPFALHGIGKRNNQEDSIFPAKGEANTNTKLFMVCDGVGGMEKGEVASNLACNSFASSKSVNPENTEDIMRAFEHTQNAFDAYIEKKPETKGMATTLVSVHIHEQGLSVTHCGDSRFYHIRAGEILWQTEDHSVINELIKAGVMTEEEAKGSKRNKISRAIQGNKVKKTKPDIHFIKDVQKEDYLFLCSDGVSGSITDAELCEILSGEESNSEKIKTIDTLCDANSADNYSAYLIQIEEVESKIPKYRIKTSENGFFDKVKSKISNIIKIDKW